MALGVTEQRQVALARCLVEHCRVGPFPATNNSQSSHFFHCSLEKLVCNSIVRGGEQTALCAKDWKGVRNYVNFVLVEVLCSEPLETVSQNHLRLSLRKYVPCHSN